MSKLAPRSLYVLAGSLRAAERALWCDMRVHPRNRAIHITTDLNYLRCRSRPVPVLLVDPLLDLHSMTMREYEEMKRLGYFRDWTDAERALVTETAE